jgi:hypothetical protein
VPARQATNAALWEPRWQACVHLALRFESGEGVAGARARSVALARLVATAPESARAPVLLAGVVTARCAAEPAPDTQPTLAFHTALLRLGIEAVGSGPELAEPRLLRPWMAAYCAGALATELGALACRDAAVPPVFVAALLESGRLLQAMARAWKENCTHHESAAGPGLTSVHFGADAPLLVASASAAAEALGAALAIAMGEPRLRAVTRRRAAPPLPDSWEAGAFAPEPEALLLDALDAVVALAACLEGLGRLPAAAIVLFDNPDGAAAFVEDLWRNAADALVQ